MCITERGTYIGVSEPLVCERLTWNVFIFIIPKTLSEVEILYIIARLRHS
jgi:hypothetical protein